jgi:hypothetical protein
MAKMAENTSVKPALNADKPAVEPVLTRVLSNGSTLTVYPVFGIHLRKAQMMTKGCPESLMYALMAQGIRIDGNPVIFEDLDAYDAFLLFEIMNSFMEGREGNFSSSTPEP